MTTPYKQALDALQVASAVTVDSVSIENFFSEEDMDSMLRALLIADAVESGVLVKNIHEYGYGEGENWGEGYNDCLDDLRRLGEEGFLKKIGAGE